MVYRRLTITQSAEIKYALDLIEEFLETGDRGKASTASAQLRSFLDTNGYRQQRCDFDHNPDSGLESR